MIPTPISQIVSGKNGIYMQKSEYRKPSMTIAEFEKLANSMKCKHPHYGDHDLEKAYWKDIKGKPSIYGADVSGTLMDSHLKVYGFLFNSIMNFEFSSLFSSKLYFKSTYKFPIKCIVTCRPLHEILLI